MPTFNMDDVELVQPEPQEGGDGPVGGGDPPDGPDGPTPPEPPGGGKGKPKDKEKSQDKEKPGEPGEGKTPDAPSADEVDVDKVHKEIEERLKKRNQLKDSEAAKKAGEEHPDFKPGAGKAGDPGKGGGIGQLTGKPDPFANPRYNWKQLVKQMIPSGIPQPVSSYAKPSKKAATSMHIAGQTGSAALPPGMRADTSEARKLAFVFDTSGSMHHTINQAMAEIPGVIKSANFDAAPIGVVFFAGDMRLFVVNIRENTYQEVSSLADMSGDMKKFPKKKNWKTVLTLQAGGGTEFKPSVLLQIKQLIDQGYNIVMFSDADMLASQNWENFVWLTVKHREHLAFIADSKNTWRAVVEKLKMNLPRFGYLEQ
jgi:hypothetical protein